MPGQRAGQDQNAAPSTLPVKESHVGSGGGRCLQNTHESAKRKEQAALNISRTFHWQRTRPSHHPCLSPHRTRLCNGARQARMFQNVLPFLRRGLTKSHPSSLLWDHNTNRRELLPALFIPTLCFLCSISLSHKKQSHKEGTVLVSIL